jgi:hypothetical protein
MLVSPRLITLILFVLFIAWFVWLVVKKRKL